ncbi:hypothetical protein [Hymenobacter sp. UYCo722]|uniref:hypothetical protein n=1 Tax=Hymenobacter sp. UYCo722 TaxID=3156335 RepID=UPI0033959261
MKNTFLLSAMAAIGMSLMSGCSKGDEPTPAPVSTETSYQVEYRVSSTTNTNATYFAYTNETGGTTTLATQALPGSVTFRRTMKRGDNVNFLISLPSTSAANSDISGVILLNGQQVAAATGRGVEASATVVYVIR